MVKVEYIYVVNRDNRKKVLFELRSIEGDIEFWSKDDKVAFEEKIESAFRQCMGAGYEVVSAGPSPIGMCVQDG